MVHFYKYHGAGNDFIILDNRNLTFEADNFTLITLMCDRRFGIGADGLMLLQNHESCDFEMRYFNSDGHEGSMCGNGGRCIVSFARRLNIIESSSQFMAVDGIHEATIEGNDRINLKMSDVKHFESIGNDFFLNTGSPHYVRFVNELAGMDVVAEGRKIRYNERFSREGTNVNFVKMEDDHLLVYTYERGVEDETLACGTGITASALCAALKTGVSEGSFPISAKGGNLEVSFEKRDKGFTNIWLKGPAHFVFDGDYLFS
jgi:diaminopimelate epimerase